MASTPPLSSPPDHGSHWARPSVGVGLTLVSTLGPTLGFPLPLLLRWVLFILGVVLILWPLLTRYGKKMSPSLIQLIGIGGIIAFAVVLGAGIILQVSSGPSLQKQPPQPAPISTGMPSTTDVAPTPAAHFIENPYIGMSYTASFDAQSAIQFQGTFGVTKNRLRLFVDLISDSTPGRPIQYERLPIDEFGDVVRGQRLLTPIITRQGGQDGHFSFRWANWRGAGRDVAPTKMAARIAIIADDGTEQHYYFYLVPAFVNGMAYIDALSSDKFGFAAQWESQGEKR